MPSRDYYDILGVAREATKDEIKKAYRKAALRDHPDRNPGDAEAEERFKQAAEAYSVLGDVDRRSRYDRFGQEGVRGAATPDFQADVFADFADILGGMFGFDMGFGRSRRQGPARGASLQYQLQIDLEQAISGVEAEIRVRRKRTCEACDGGGSASGSGASVCEVCGGQGQVQQRHGFLTIARTCHRCGGYGQVITDPCDRCRGAGRAAETTTLKVKVPAGVDTGMRLLLRGEGESGVRGGPPGDLAVQIEVRDHPRFVRRGGDLYTRVPVSFPRLVLGGQIEVPTLDGEAASLQVPAGVQSGDVLSIRGRGMPSVNGNRRGDLKVTLQVVTPRTVGRRERELLEELEELLPTPEELEDSTSWWDRLRSVFG